MRNTTSIVGSGENTACSIPLSLGEILARIERRLAWYGLPSSGVRALEARHAGRVVIMLEVGGSGIFREELDPWTGVVRNRALTGPALESARTTNG